MAEKKELNVYQKLQQARVLLQQKQLKKSGENKYSGFKYFELSDFLPAINSIFNEIGLFSVVNYNEKESTLVICNSDKPEEQIIFNSPNAEIQLKGCHSIQNIGAVETYQRRYLYITALEIAENDILDFSSGEQTNNQEHNNQECNKQEYNNQENDSQNSLICHNCGRVIKAYKDRSANEIANESLKKYGHRYCAGCCLSLKKIEAEQEEILQ